ncbi:MAG: TIGR04197 family type VII secretion effector [Lachnotalea sp.]
MIELKMMDFQTATNRLVTAANELSQVKDQKPEATGNCEPLKQYIECFQAMQEVLKEYSNLLKTDSERIRSAGNAMKFAEQNLLSLSGR